MLVKFVDGSEREIANLRHANLRHADLSGANLRHADLSGANLRHADLRDANLSSADLRDANLSSANLSGANLSDADLRDANLRHADLRDADLRDADLRAAQGLATQVIVSQGDVRAWKKVQEGVVELLIPAAAQRVNGIGSRKCRAEYAVVVSAPGGKAYGLHNPSFLYKTGEIVRPDSWNPDVREVCTHGIHFFITEQEAIEYS